jgi:hypothetical protein
MGWDFFFTATSRLSLVPILPALPNPMGTEDSFFLAKVSAVYELLSRTFQTLFGVATGNDGIEFCQQMLSIYYFVNGVTTNSLIILLLFRIYFFNVG